MPQANFLEVQAAILLFFGYFQEIIPGAAISDFGGCPHPSSEPEVVWENVDSSQLSPRFGAAGYDGANSLPLGNALRSSVFMPYADDEAR